MIVRTLDGAVVSTDGRGVSAAADDGGAAGEFGARLLRSGRATDASGADAGGAAGAAAGVAPGFATVRTAGGRSGVESSSGPASRLRNAVGDNDTAEPANFLNTLGSGFTDPSSARSESRIRSSTMR
jgi:hypothetical protein